jgi:HKD family nuclease
MEVEKKLIVNSDKGNLLKELVRSMNEFKSFYFSVAFINFSGLRLLLDPLKEA